MDLRVGVKLQALSWIVQSRATRGLLPGRQPGLYGPVQQAWSPCNRFWNLPGDKPVTRRKRSGRFGCLKKIIGREHKNC